MQSKPTFSLWFKDSGYKKSIVCSYWSLYNADLINQKKYIMTVFKTITPQQYWGGILRYVLTSTMQDSSKSMEHRRKAALFLVVFLEQGYLENQTIHDTLCLYNGRVEYEPSTTGAINTLEYASSVLNDKKASLELLKISLGKSTFFKNTKGNGENAFSYLIAAANNRSKTAKQYWGTFWAQTCETQIKFLDFMQARDMSRIGFTGQ